MPQRVRLFIDFWNFQLNWNDQMDPQRCDWSRMPTAVLHRTYQVLDALAFPSTSNSKRPCSTLP